MTREEAKKEMLFAKRNVMAGSWIDKAYDVAIKALSEPEQRWIPVTERLPEEKYWLGGSSKQFSEIVDVTVVNHGDGDIFVDTTHTVDGKWALELPRWFEIIAWMPLVEPYSPKEKPE